MIRAVILPVAICFASQAMALSCLPPDVRMAFETAQGAPERHIVATGTLYFDARKLPMAVLNDSPPKTMISARLTGEALTATGFDLEFDRDITLEVLCFGPWCGGAGSGVSYLAFLRQDEDGHVLSADPCSSLLFHEPSRKMLDTVAQCVWNGRCPGP